MPWRSITGSTDRSFIMTCRLHQRHPRCPPPCCMFALRHETGGVPETEFFHFLLKRASTKLLLLFGRNLRYRQRRSKHRLRGEVVAAVLLQRVNKVHRRKWRPQTRKQVEIRRAISFFFSVLLMSGESRLRQNFRQQKGVFFDTDRSSFVSPAMVQVAYSSSHATVQRVCSVTIPAERARRLHPRPQRTCLRQAR